MSRDPRRPRLVHLADFKPQPWKNGGGITRDLLLWPNSKNWQLRISVAEVARSGPFSAYPGIARWFAVLQGGGVLLRFGAGADEDQLALTPDSPPLHFDGAAAPGCDLLDGPTLDLNLMARQDAGRAEMARAVDGVPWSQAAPFRAVFALQACTLQGAGPAALHLSAGTLAYATEAAAAPWCLSGDTLAAWWLAYEPHAR